MIRIWYFFVPIYAIQFQVIIEKYCSSKIGLNYKFKVVKTANILSWYKVVNTKYEIESDEIINNIYLL